MPNCTYHSAYPHYCMYLSIPHVTSNTILSKEACYKVCRKLDCYPLQMEHFCWKKSWFKSDIWSSIPWAFLENSCHSSTAKSLAISKPCMHAFCLYKCHQEPNLLLNFYPFPVTGPQIAQTACGAFDWLMQTKCNNVHWEGLPNSPDSRKCLLPA